MTDTPQIPDIPKTAAQHWAHIQTMFKSRTVMRPTLAWTSAISTRLGRSRLSKLRSSNGAKALEAYLQNLSFKEIKTLRTYAAVNQEQALAAFRLTLIANITAPLAFIAFIHQITNGGLPELLSGAIGDPSHTLLVMFWAVAAFIAVALLILLYAIACLGQARDLRHLMDIYAAERGIYFGLEDMDDLNLS